jgi:hypothetical protein
VHREVQRRENDVKELSVSREISAPASTVWALATDLDRWVEVVSGIDGVERLDGGAGFGPGTRWRETRTLFGKQATEDIEITDVDSGRRYDTLAESHGARYHSAVQVDAIDDARSRLTMSFDAEPQSLLAKVLGVVMGPMMASASRKALERDLADLAAAAELDAAQR